MIKTNQLDLEHRSLIRDFFTRFPPEISEHTFTNFFAWNNSRPVYFALVDESLVFFIEEKKSLANRRILFGPAAGRLSLAETIEIFGSTIGGAVRLPADSAAELTAAGYDLHADRDNADYVYRVEDLAQLAGRHYAKKLNQVKKCLNAHHCEYEPVTSSLIPDCIAMQQRWCASKSCTTDPGLCDEYLAILSMFENFTELDLIGGAIRIDGEIEAFSIAEQLSPGTAVCHFEKALPGVQGLGQLINQWFALYGLTDFTFINREQDLGVPGLRQAKKSYHPHHLVDKYILSLDTDEPVCKIFVQGCADEQD